MHEKAVRMSAAEQCVVLTRVGGGGCLCLASALAQHQQQQQQRTGRATDRQRSFYVT